MRLICAGCGAQYEVAERAIPDDGREVKCSACGHVWFQMPPPAFGDAQPLPRRPVDPDALRILREEAEREARARHAPRAESPQAAGPVPQAGAPVAAAEGATLTLAETAEGGRDDANGADDGAAGPQAATAEPVPGKATTTPVVAEAGAPAPGPAFPDPVLEPSSGIAAAALSSDPAIGTATPRMAQALPPDAAIPETATAQAAAQAPVQPAGSPAAGAPAAPAPDVPRTDDPEARPVRATPARAPLPDPRAAQSSLAAAPVERRRGRFATGLVAALVLLGLLAGLYVVAPGMAQDAPAAAPYLHGYVQTIDEARHWLDTTMAPLLARLQP